MGTLLEWRKTVEDAGNDTLLFLAGITDPNDLLVQARPKASNVRHIRVYPGYWHYERSTAAVFAPVLCILLPVGKLHDGPGTSDAFHVAVVAPW